MIITFGMLFLIWRIRRDIRKLESLDSIKESIVKNNIDSENK